MRTVHVLGVPLRSGSLYPGSEDDAKPYREANLVGRLEAAGCRVQDAGDLAVPSYLPHHSVPPIRSWPGPRIVWDCVRDRLVPLLQDRTNLPLLIGCDCSIVVGTTDALARVAGENLHVLYVDGDFDDAAPDPARCQSAAAVAVWLLTHGAPFWAGPALRPSQITVVGTTGPSLTATPGLRAISLAEVRRLGPVGAARAALDGIAPGASLLLHLDIDVFQHHDVPAAYFPHTEGLTWMEGLAMVSAFLRDPRLRLVEVAEYAALRDGDQRTVNHLIDLLCEGLREAA
jgi:arginase